MARGAIRATGLVAAVAFVAACGARSGQPNTAAQSSPTTSSQHSPVAGSTQPGSPQIAVHHCATRQLTITLRGLAGLGHGGYVLEFHNRGRLCALYGYPGVDGLNRGGHAVISARRTPRGYLGGLGQGVPEKAVTLARGQTASAILEGLNAPLPSAPCRRYSSLEVTPPGETHSVRLASASGLCYPQIHPVVPGLTGREL